MQKACKISNWSLDIPLKQYGHERFATKLRRKSIKVEDIPINEYVSMLIMVSTKTDLKALTFLDMYDRKPSTVL